MCGIIGAFPGIEKNKFDVAVKSLSHRGPDSAGYYLDRKTRVQLGHLRLSIIDLTEKANQPMEFEHLVLVFNGEIFNYKELRNELISFGYSFETSSDTEVLLKAWHCWGESCLNKLNGMWAFCVYNVESNTLILCRDRFGIKPLYYFQSAGQLFFASEMNSLRVLIGEQFQPNSEVLKTISSGRSDWHGTERNWIKDGLTVPSGSLVKFNLHDPKPVLSKWYHLTKVDVPKTYREQVEVLRNLIFDSIILRLRSDVPVATCLSGGVDSSSIVSYINEMEKSQSGVLESFSHESFCASFKNSPIDESGMAKSLSDSLGMKLNVLEVENPTADELEQVMHQYDGPANSLAFFPIMRLYREIRESGIKVTLDGQGPDEMLGGYKPLNYGVRDALSRGAIKRLIDLYNTYGSTGESKQHSSKSFARTVLKSELSNFLKDGVKGLTGIGKLSNYSAQGGPSFLNHLFDRHLYFQFFNNPLPAILNQFDRCSMANGVECRMPFMDYRIVEYIFSLSQNSKTGNGYTKRILRDAGEGILMDQIRLNRTKIGFNAPLVDWYSGDLGMWMLDQMNSTQFQESEYFDGKKIFKEFEGFLRSDNKSWKEAWKFWGPVHVNFWVQNTSN